MLHLDWTKVLKLNYFSEWIWKNRKPFFSVQVTFFVFRASLKKSCSLFYLLSDTPTPNFTYARYPTQSCLTARKVPSPILLCQQVIVLYMYLCVPLFSMWCVCEGPSMWYWSTCTYFPKHLAQSWCWVFSLIIPYLLRQSLLAKQYLTN